MTMLSFNLSVVSELLGSAELADEARTMSDLAFATMPKDQPTAEVLMANYRSMTELILGDLEAALAYTDRAAGTRQTGDLITNDPVYNAQVMSRRAVISHLLGDDDASLASAAEAERLLARGPGVRWAPTQALSAAAGIAVAAAAAGEAQRAHSHARDQLLGAQATGDPLLLNDALITCAVVVFVGGHDVESAARLLAAARATAVTAGGAGAGFGAPTGYALYRHYVPIVRRALDPEVARRRRREGQLMSSDEAVRYALTGLE